MFDTRKCFPYRAHLERSEPLNGSNIGRERGSLESLFLRAKAFLVFKLFYIVNMERETQAAFGCELVLEASTPFVFALIYQVVNVNKVTDCFDVSFIL